jgi:hypothetical protein
MSFSFGQALSFGVFRGVFALTTSSPRLSLLNGTVVAVQRSTPPAPILDNENSTITATPR